jgi:hypothetical protein
VPVEPGSRIVAIQAALLEIGLAILISQSTYVDELFYIPAAWRIRAGGAAAASRNDLA